MDQNRLSKTMSKPDGDKNKKIQGWGKGCLNDYYCSEFNHVNTSVGEVMSGLYGYYPDSGFIYDVSQD